jgi:hypothetical protein
MFDFIENPEKHFKSNVTIYFKKEGFDETKGGYCIHN